MLCVDRPTPPHQSPHHGPGAVEQSLVAAFSATERLGCRLPCSALVLPLPCSCPALARQDPHRQPANTRLDLLHTTRHTKHRPGEVHPAYLLLPAPHHGLTHTYTTHTNIHHDVEPDRATGQGEVGDGGRGEGKRGEGRGYLPSRL